MNAQRMVDEWAASRQRALHRAEDAENAESRHYWVTIATTLRHCIEDAVCVLDVDCDTRAADEIVVGAQ